MKRLLLLGATLAVTLLLGNCAHHPHLPHHGHGHGGVFPHENIHHWKHHHRHNGC